MIKGVEIRFGEAVDESFEFCPEFFKGAQGFALCGGIEGHEILIKHEGHKGHEVVCDELRYAKKVMFRVRFRMSNANFANGRMTRMIFCLIVRADLYMDSKKIMKIKIFVSFVLKIFFFTIKQRKFIHLHCIGC